MKRVRRNAVAIALTAWLASSAVAAEPEDHPGAAVYARHCAACHQGDLVRAPALSALKALNAESLRLSLTEGVMVEQGRALSRRELAVLIDYLARKESDGDAWYAGMLCDSSQVDLTAAAVLPRVGISLESTRHLTAQAAGLSSADLAKLELKWAMGFPDTNALRAAPVIVGSTLFYTAPQTSRLVALDVREPCVKWVYDAGVPLKTSLSFGVLGKAGSKALVLADRRGQVHAVDAATGTRIWMAEGRHSPGAAITGGPTLHGEQIIVPVSGSGVGRGANPEYECCVEHGAVVALDAATGEQRWTYHTMPDATYNGRVSRVGVKLRGPSGAPIWSTPTIDAERGLVYVTTGQNTSLPATDTSDAVLALDLETGEQRWGFQALANDVWIISCRVPWERSGPNCPSPEDSVLKDFDFGAAAILSRGAGRRDVLLAGQKSGDVWALDPDTGKLLWNTRFGQGTPLGGVHWGMAADAGRLFVPINDPLRTPGAAAEPGMNAVDIVTGKVLWRTPTRPDCSAPRRQRLPGCATRHGLSAAPLVIDASVIAGAIDGRLYVFDAASGEVVFEYDTARDFDTVNGVPAHGGAIDSHSVFAGAGMVFVASGYGRFRQAPGNVLLAFGPRE